MFTLSLLIRGSLVRAQLQEEIKKGYNYGGSPETGLEPIAK